MIPQTPSSEFTVTMDVEPDWPLEPGEYATVTVEYAPVDTVEDYLILTFASNDPTLAKASVGVETTCVGNDLVEDEREQVATPSTDVLWVLDNSPSMVVEQAFLKSMVPTFVDVAIPAGHLGHLGVVTTDDSYLRGNPTVLTTDMPDILAAFSEVVAVGTGGAETSLGLAMGSQAITPPLAAPGGSNDGFLREYAGLLVIVVSDEEDESPDTVTAYVNLFQSLKVDPDKVRVIAVTGGAAGCQSAVADAEPETRYTDSADRSGGLHLSICDETWVQQLAGLPWDSLGWVWAYELSQDPQVSTLAVEVGGVVVTEGWSYDAGLNAVVFDEAGLPAAGTPVVLRYLATPEC